jgi:hypothetical protein
MNPMVYRLLKGYLLRNAWLYSFIGVLQFLMTGIYWVRGYDRASVVGLILGVWGAVAALNRNSLVWRSLPLTSQEASQFRWWAIAGAPGVFLTLLTFIAWASQRSSRFPTPDTATVLGCIFAIWAALGVLAMLPRAAGWFSKKFRTAGIMAVVVGVAPLLAFGVPVGSVSRPYSLVIVSAGLILLLVSAARAHGGTDWRWPDPAGHAPRSSQQRAASWLTHHYGLSAILFPLAQRTAIFATAATVIIVSLQRIFPQASVALFWVYFIGLSTTGFLLTYQVRMAFQPLRCLPLSVKQLAGFLMLFGALPGLATLGLTLLINRAVLGAGLDIGQVATFAFIIIAIQVFPVSQMTVPQRSKFFEYWMPLIQRFLVPLYMGLMAAGWNEAYGRFTWMRWALQAGGIVLCIIGYFALVQQLRAGIRPSSNEKAFS